MGEGIAASEPLGENNFSNVVQFPARPVEYAGSAAHLMNGLALNIDTLRRALYRLNKANHRAMVLELIDKISKTMEMIQDHMDVIDENAEAISDCLEMGQEAYFLSETSKSLFDVISLIERRQTTLMVQRFSFRPAGGKLPAIAHDNNRPVLLSHEGRMACQWPRVPKPTPPAKVSKRRRAR